MNRELAKRLDNVIPEIIMNIGMTIENRLLRSFMNKLFAVSEMADGSRPTLIRNNTSKFTSYVVPHTQIMEKCKNLNLKEVK